MNGRAVVIRTAGDPEIAGAIVDGMTQSITPLNEHELAVVKAELDRLKAAYGVMKPRDGKYWADKISALDAKYEAEPKRRVADALTLVWAMLWVTIQEWFTFFAEWNREQ